MLDGIPYENGERCEKFDSCIFRNSQDKSSLIFLNKWEKHEKKITLPEHISKVVDRTKHYITLRSTWGMYFLYDYDQEKMLLSDVSNISTLSKSTLIYPKWEVYCIYNAATWLVEKEFSLTDYSINDMLKWTQYEKLQHIETIVHGLSIRYSTIIFSKFSDQYIVEFELTLMYKSRNMMGKSKNKDTTVSIPFDLVSGKAIPNL